ncbi:class I SAM-dependent methyltransferase [Penaeicola halotolerans]|uniref:class I SAM-dependent methyltransferase n=1 Tax=Penaeicola halotolerans TaxID=2793196 RepID=UPI001CF839A3|nr:class I SAM-dependent methyltransferase [Penaeicola halotolerans]
MDISALNQLFGNIDLYLLDQILKGRYTPEMKILDVGCGEGRNTIYFLREGYQIFGVDQDPIAIQMCRMQARSIRKDYDILRFQECAAEDLLFHEGAFDAVISSAVLHFAQSEEHFIQMWSELCRVLKPGGSLFIRTVGDFGGLSAQSKNLGEGRFLLPDGSERFVLTENLLNVLLKRFKLGFLENPKSVLVLGQREMTSLMLIKEA